MGGLSDSGQTCLFCSKVPRIPYVLQYVALSSGQTGFLQRCRESPRQSCRISFWARTICATRALHMATSCHILPQRSNLGNYGTSVTTPFVLTPSGSCQFHSFMVWDLWSVGDAQAEKGDPTMPSSRKVTFEPRSIVFELFESLQSDLCGSPLFGSPFFGAVNIRYMNHTQITNHRGTDPDTEETNVSTDKTQANTGGIRNMFHKGRGFKSHTCVRTAANAPPRFSLKCP